MKSTPTTSYITCYTHFRASFFFFHLGALPTPSFDNMHSRIQIRTWLFEREREYLSGAARLNISSHTFNPWSYDTTRSKERTASAIPPDKGSSGFGLKREGGTTKITYSENQEKWLFWFDVFINCGQESRYYIRNQASVEHHNSPGFRLRLDRSFFRESCSVRGGRTL